MQRRIGGIDLDRGRQHFVVQGKHRLDQSRTPRGSFGVPDLRLHRAECAPVFTRVIGRIKDPRQTLEFREVARTGACAVGFHQFDRLGSIACSFVGAAQRLGLTFGHGCIDALGLTVR